MTEKNLAEIPNKVSFRQSFNQWTHNWTVPKREYLEKKDGKDTKGQKKKAKWRPVQYKLLTPVVTKHEGFRFAIWRIHKVMKNIRDEKGRQVWKVSNIRTKYFTHNDIRYSRYQFDCYRIEYSIVGGMNVQGGN